MAILVAPLAAQADHFATSPEGYEYREGNSDSRDLLGTVPQLRYQQIDSTNTRTLTNRNRIAFRRDGYLFDNPAYGARTIELELVMSESDLDNLSTTFANNYKTNTAVVLSRQKVSFDDWTMRPAAPPAGQSTEIFFNQIWTYFGTVAGGTDLLWELRVWSNDHAGQEYPFDLEYVVPNATFSPRRSPTRSTSTALGAGCSVPGAGSAFALAPTLLNYADQMALQIGLSGGPASTPALLFLDGQAANLSLPQLCSTLRALPGLALPLGSTDGLGALALGPLTFPHDASIIGQTVYTQAAAPCPACFAGQADVALSDAHSLAMPGDPPAPAIGRLWALNPTATTATFGPEPGGVVLWTNH